MEQLTTYTAKGKTIGLEFLFKYDLNGNLRAFEIVEGDLNKEQIDWLFSSNFPSAEQLMKSDWMKKEKYVKHFEVQVSPADISFDTGWKIYDHKLAKQDAEKAFKKMTEPEKIKFFISLPGYERYLKKSGIAKAHMATYINKRYYENEYPEAVGKNYNSALHDLAKKKTDK
jgi:hypothetical protein